MWNELMQALRQKGNMFRYLFIALLPIYFIYKKQIKTFLNLFKKCNMKLKRKDPQLSFHHFLASGGPCLSWSYFSFKLH